MRQGGRMEQKEKKKSSACKVVVEVVFSTSMASRSLSHFSLSRSSIQSNSPSGTLHSRRLWGRQRGKAKEVRQKGRKQGGERGRCDFRRKQEKVRIFEPRRRERRRRRRRRRNEEVFDCQNSGSVPGPAPGRRHRDRPLRDRQRRAAELLRHFPGGAAPRAAFRLADLDLHRPGQRLDAAARAAAAADAPAAFRSPPPPPRSRRFSRLYLIESRLNVWGSGRREAVPLLLPFQLQRPLRLPCGCGGGGEIIGGGGEEAARPRPRRGRGRGCSSRLVSRRRRRRRRGGGVVFVDALEGREER